MQESMSLRYEPDSCLIVRARADPPTEVLADIAAICTSQPKLSGCRYRSEEGSYLRLMDFDITQL